MIQINTDREQRRKEIEIFRKVGFTKSQAMALVVVPRANIESLEYLSNMLNELKEDIEDG